MRLFDMHEGGCDDLLFADLHDVIDIMGNEGIGEIAECLNFNGISDGVAGPLEANAFLLI